MSNTVYEKNGIAFTRYWGGNKGDCIQITINGAYTQMTLTEFKRAVKAVNKNVRDNADAWWHKIGGSNANS